MYNVNTGATSGRVDEELERVRASVCFILRRFTIPLPQEHVSRDS